MRPKRKRLRKGMLRNFRKNAHMLKQYGLLRQLNCPSVEIFIVNGNTYIRIPDGSFLLYTNGKLVNGLLEPVFTVNSKIASILKDPLGPIQAYHGVIDEV